MKEKILLSVAASNAEIHYLNSCKTHLPELTCVDFGKSEFLNIIFFIGIELFTQHTIVFFGIFILLGHFK